MNLLRKIGAIGMPDGVSIVANENDMLSVKAYGEEGADNMPSSVLFVKGKADKDLNNAIPSASFKSEVSGWGMPSNEVINIISQFNTEKAIYIAPANGWLVCKYRSASVDYKGIEIIGGNNAANLVYTVSDSYLSIPVPKGREILQRKGATVTVNSAYFVYANGEI